MREILFRGKRIDNGEWIEGDLVGGNMICPTLEDVEDAMGTYYGQIPYVGFIEVIPETVGMYTGLTDKNGVKIFEGDIVGVIQGKRKDVCLVGWENGAFMLYPKNGNIYERTLWDYWYNDWEIEVISNVHDRPEFWKVGE